MVSGGKSPPFLAEGAEEDSVKELLRGSEDVVGRYYRVPAAEPGEGVLPHGGVLDVELLRQFLSRLLGGGLEGVEVAAPDQRHHPLRRKQEEELAEKVIVRGEPLGVKALVGVLVAALEVEPGLADGGDDDPVAGQVDGVVVTLLDRRHALPGKGTV